eukprot:GHVR01019465.1.p1 GENE.GHVR01019465.1~~GHVR01019465.1.p1  ORF type:complete len:109 (+),score=63.87 GHVR01019465.1:46-372(+)
MLNYMIYLTTLIGIISALNLQEKEGEHKIRLNDRLTIKKIKTLESELLIDLTDFGGLYDMAITMLAPHTHTPIHTHTHTHTYWFCTKDVTRHTHTHTHTHIHTPTRGE